MLFKFRFVSSVRPTPLGATKRTCFEVISNFLRHNRILSHNCTAIVADNPDFVALNGKDFYMV